MLSRRAFVNSIGLTAAASVMPLYSRLLASSCATVSKTCPPVSQKGRVQILDMSNDVRPYLKKFRAGGVRSIGRYYGRAPDHEQGHTCNWPGRSLSKEELGAIEEAGLSVFTVFQHCNQCSGFLGSEADPKTMGQDTYDALTNKAALDADAVAQMANELGQPAETPIYFGIDFDPTAGRGDCKDGTFKTDDEILLRIKDYFEQINDRLRKDGHLVGAYGSGAICTYLRELPPYKGKPLVEYFWLSASIAHQGHADFFNSGQWHLYQNKTEIPQIDYMKTGAVAGHIDTDVSNPDFPNFGQWRRKSAKPPEAAPIPRGRRKDPRRPSLLPRPD